MNALPDHIARVRALQKALGGKDTLSSEERLSAAYELARGIADNAFALRDFRTCEKAAQIDSPIVQRKAIDQLRAELNRKLVVASVYIHDADRLILPTRSAVFRSGKMTKATAHAAAVNLGWRCRDTTTSDGWPDKDELFAEIEHEYAQAVARLPPPGEVKDDGKPVFSSTAPSTAATNDPTVVPWSDDVLEEHLTPLARSLLRFMWPRDRAHTDELANDVWGDEEMSPNSLNKFLCMVRKFLLTHPPKESAKGNLVKVKGDPFVKWQRV